MRFPKPLIRGRLIRRYKRFLADVELESGETVVAHCANPGSMLGLKDPGSDVWLSHHDDPRRKLSYSWELLRVGDTLVGINTALPNRLVAEALDNGVIEELQDYAHIRREVPVGGSRLDFVLDRAHEFSPSEDACYLEVKNVHLKRAEAAEFPDSVTRRGARHLAELAALAKAGKRAVMLFVVQRQDCPSFRLARDIDPAYAEAFEAALAQGVDALCYRCHIDTDQILVKNAIPIEI